MGANDAAAKNDWNPIREKLLQTDVAESRIDSLLLQCQKNGLSREEATSLIDFVSVAYREELPTECIFTKIEEGLAKKVASSQIVVAVGARLDCLRRADRMISEVRGKVGQQYKHLVMHTCMAMESGLPETTLETLFKQHPKFRFGRMIHVVESGETLQLAGLEPQDVLRVMNDFLDRDLSYPEIIRAIDYIQTERSKGTDFNTLYKTLWINSK